MTVQVVSIIAGGHGVQYIVVYLLCTDECLRKPKQEYAEGNLVSIRLDIRTRFSFITERYLRGVSVMDVHIYHLFPCGTLGARSFSAPDLDP